MVEDLIEVHLWQLCNRRRKREEDFRREVYAKTKVNERRSK